MWALPNLCIGTAWQALEHAVVADISLSFNPFLHMAGSMVSSIVVVRATRTELPACTINRYELSQDAVVRSNQ